MSLEKIDLVEILNRNNIADSGLKFKLIGGELIYQLVYSTMDNQFYVVVERAVLAKKPYITASLNSPQQQNTKGVFQRQKTEGYPLRPFVNGHLEAYKTKTFYVEKVAPT